ncbi:peroxidase-like protein [Enterobacter asburiae]|uniref:Peroxidase-like protein n=1 Tax=Enterobacter asburiae TaxID=61645 RepID=A0A376FAE9_ENTAS|nr:peroxidase-like protein [Enterobacter asburiae]
MSLSQDILAELAEIKPGSPLAEARATRDAATRHAQGSYEILFSQQDADFALDERFAVAAKVARWHRRGGAGRTLCRVWPGRSHLRTPDPGR